MIRKATPSDAPHVAPLIIQAMGELAQKFTNYAPREKIIALFENFFQQKNNQYSFENTLIFENETGTAGALNAYDGGKLAELRKPFFEHLSKYFGLGNFHPEPETEPREFYFDTISVNSKEQGKGIGKELILAGINWAADLNFPKVGLLAEKTNIRAIKLYEKSGFKIENEKLFIGTIYYHMIYEIANNKKPEKKI